MMVSDSCTINIINDASTIVIHRVTLQFVASLPDDYIAVTYDHNMFIVQVTDFAGWEYLLSVLRLSYDHIKWLWAA